MTRATPARARERDIVGWARVAPRVERASRARDARGATLGRAGHVAWYDARENVVACAGGRAARGTCAGLTIGARRRARDAKRDAKRARGRDLSERARSGTPGLTRTRRATR